MDPRHATKLTRDDVKMLKNAAKVVVFALDEGDARLDVYLDGLGAGDEDARLAIASEGVPVGMWANAHVTLGSLRYFGPATTAMEHLRAGDRVYLRWDDDGHTSGYAEDAGLHVDTLELVRITPGGTRRVYHLTMTVSPDNTARMFRPEDEARRESLRMPGEKS